MSPKIKIIAALLVVVIGCSAAESNVALPGKLVAEPSEEFLELGNGRVHFRVTRGASPTIVLESAADGDLSQWDSLQLKIAQVTGMAVVSYDRPGFGKSDLPSSAYDPVLEMQQLRDGLKRLGLPMR